MQSTFEKLGGTYRQEGDYLLPNVKAPESPAIGVWGQRRHKYLVEHNHALYTALLLSGKLTTHLEEIDRVASKMYDRLVEQLKQRDGITEIGMVAVSAFCDVQLFGSNSNRCR